MVGAICYTAGYRGGVGLVQNQGDDEVSRSRESSAYKGPSAHGVSKPRDLPPPPPDRYKEPTAAAQKSRAVREENELKVQTSPNLNRRVVVCIIPTADIREIFGLPKDARLIECNYGDGKGNLMIKAESPSLRAVDFGEMYPTRRATRRSVESLRASVRPKMTWLGPLNRYLLQWFFIRLARKVDDNCNHAGWTVLRWVWPRSGYGGRPFEYLGRRKSE